MKEYGVVRLFTAGEGADTYVSLARSELGMMKTIMRLGGLQQMKRTRNLPDGTVIEVASIFGQDYIKVVAPTPVPAKVESAPKRTKTEIIIIGEDDQGAFVWSSRTGSTSLPTPETPWGSAYATPYAVSRDGNTIVGECWDDFSTYAVRWSRPNDTSTFTFHSLGAKHTPDQRGVASDVSDDGKVIVGSVFDDTVTGAQTFDARYKIGFRWDAASGDTPETVTYLHTAKPAAPNYHALHTASVPLNVSADGKTIFGTSGPDNYLNRYSAADILTLYWIGHWHLAAVPEGEFIFQLGDSLFRGQQSPSVIDFPYADPGMETQAHDYRSFYYDTSIAPQQWYLPLQRYRTESVGELGWWVRMDASGDYIHSYYVGNHYTGSPAEALVVSGKSLEDAPSGGQKYVDAPAPIVSNRVSWGAAGYQNIGDVVGPCITSKDGSTSAFQRPTYTDVAWVVSRAGADTVVSTPSGFQWIQINALSANGSIAVGMAVALDYSHRAFRWTAADGLKFLASPAGATEVEALGISDDGSIIVGFAGNSAVMWTDGGFTQETDEQGNVTFTPVIPEILPNPYGRAYDATVVKTEIT